MNVRKVVLGLLAAAVVVAMVLMAVMLLRRGSELGQPRWTEADLPPHPPAEHNGWITLMGEGTAIDITPVEGSDAVETEPTSEASLDERWSTIDAQSGAIARRVQANAPALERWHVAAAAPSFADACPLTVTATCQYFQGHLVHLEALAEVLALALARDWAAADRNLALALDVDRRLLESCVGLMGCLIATSNLERTLGVTELVLSRQAQSHDAGPERQLLLRAVQEHRGLDHAAVLDRMVIGHYLSTRSVLEMMMAPEGEDAEAGGTWESVMFFDPAKTSSVLDELHHELMERAHGREVETTVQWSQMDRIFNMVGVLLIDPEVLRELAGARLDDGAAALEGIAQRREEILRRWGEP